MMNAPSVSMHVILVPLASINSLDTTVNACPDTTAMDIPAMVR